MHHRSAVAFAFFFLAASLPGCASGPQAGDADSPRMTGEQQIRAAIIGHELAAPPTVDQIPAKVIFVSLGHATENREPDEDLLKLLPAGALPAKPFSACDFEPGGATDKLTGARGVVLQLGDIRWENDDRATVQATVWAAKGLGAVNVFHMTKEGGKWIVKTRQEMGAA